MICFESPVRLPDATVEGTMRAILLLPFLLVACAPHGQVASPDNRSAEEGVCAMAVAEHIGGPVASVTATWEEPAPDGGAVIAVRAPDSLHTCEIGADLHVRKLLHPQGREA